MPFSLWDADGGGPNAMSAHDLVSRAASPAQRMLDNIDVLLQARRATAQALQAELNDSQPTGYVYSIPQVESWYSVVRPRGRVPIQTADRNVAKAAYIQMKKEVDKLALELREFRNEIDSLSAQLARMSPSQRHNALQKIEMHSSKPVGQLEVEQRSAAELDVLLTQYGMGLEDIERLWDLAGVGGNAVGATDANVDALRAMLDRFGLPVDLGLSRGIKESLLHEAADNDLADMCKFLIEERGADVFKPNFAGDTPFTSAARESKARVMRYMCHELPASTLTRLVSAKNKTGYDPLALCVLACKDRGKGDGPPESGPLEVFKLLVDAGADVNARSNSGSSILAKLATLKNMRNRRGADCEVAERAMRYLLEESPRRHELDFATRMSGDEFPAPTSIVQLALDNANAEARRLVLSAAAARERTQPCSGDPDNMLGLRAGGSTDAGTQARRMAALGLGGGFGGLPGAGGYVPRSDPPPDACATCGRTATTRCSGCSSARFCSRACQVQAWPIHKKLCAGLRSRLPDRVQVLRHRHGAEIGNPDALVPSDVCTPCDVPEPCEDVSDGGGETVSIGGIAMPIAKLSNCARAHLSVVRSLTAEQLAARYEPACKERWGRGPMGDAKHRVDGKVGVRLDALLLDESFEGCDDCGADGEQFFSFCLNRPVNANMVTHCSFCGRCYYGRHGTTRCAHCKRREPDEFLLGSRGRAGVVNSETERWKYEEPLDEFQAGLAAEGFWGF